MNPVALIEAGLQAMALELVELRAENRLLKLQREALAEELERRLAPTMKRRHLMLHRRKALAS